MSCWALWFDFEVINLKLHSSEPDVQTLVRRIENGDIDLQPEFQRQEVWSKAKKKKLIDTILRDWSIPPIHLVRGVDGRSEVLDGQQRLTALRDFVANRFSIDGTIEPVDTAIQGLHGKFYRNLPDDVRRQVEGFPIRCFSITDYRPDEPSELFYRLNQPLMLTSGEKRNSLYGQARDQLKGLVSFMTSEAGLGKDTLGFSNTRLSYDDIVARLLMFLEEGSIAEKSTEARVSDRFRKGTEFDQSTTEKVKDVLKRFGEIKARAADTKMNKANLLSWLLFLSRDPSNFADGEFFEIFQDRLRVHAVEQHIVEARELFSDRARLRVSDVSSVIYRDFCLWYCFAKLYNSPLPQNVSREIIDGVHNHFSASSDSGGTFENSVEKYVSSATWGRL